MAYFLAVSQLVFILLGPGVLAPADIGCLERVEARRVEYEYGLSSIANPDTVLIAVESCEYLGRDGVIVVGDEVYQARVVDCQQDKHTPLSELGIVADVNRQELGHREAWIVLYDH